MTSPTRRPDWIWLFAFTLSMIGCATSLAMAPIYNRNHLQFLDPDDVYRLLFRAKTAGSLSVAFFSISIFFAYRIFRNKGDRSRRAALLGAALITLAGVLFEFIVWFAYSGLFAWAFKAGLR